MSFLGSLFGANPNVQANTNNAVTQSGINSSYANQQNALAGSNNALFSQQALAQALSQQNGLGNQSNVFNQQQGLANQLQAESLGQGPNPAQAQLAQNTGTNVANQAALMAGQRGAGANTGLIARQAAQQGAATQQQAVGQEATQQAQQQLNAQAQLQAQQQAMAGTAQNQIANQIGQTNAVSGASQGLQGLAQQQYGTMLSANNAQNQAALQNAQMQSTYDTNQLNAATGFLSGAKSGAGNVTGGIGSSLASVGTLFASQGGQIGYYAEGGPVYANGNNTVAPMKENYEGKSKLGKYLHHHKYAQGGKAPKKIDVMLSPGEIKLSPEEAKKVAAGKMNPMHGKRVPGKAAVKGDSLKNDVVADKLSEGSVVVKRTKARDPEEAKKFVQAVMSRSKKAK